MAIAVAAAMFFRRAGLVAVEISMTSAIDTGATICLDIVEVAMFSQWSTWGFACLVHLDVSNSGVIF